METISLVCNAEEKRIGVKEISKLNCKFLLSVTDGTNILISKKTARHLSERGFHCSQFLIHDQQIGACVLFAREETLASREELQIVRCMSYDDFKSILGAHTESYYTEKWEQKESNFFSWISSIDEDLYRRFIYWAKRRG